jgi:hypothetical protein
MPLNWNGWPEPSARSSQSGSLRLSQQYPIPDDRSLLSATPGPQAPQLPVLVVQSSERTPDRSLYTQTCTDGFARLRTGIRRKSHELRMTTAFSRAIMASCARVIAWRRPSSSKSVNVLTVPAWADRPVAAGAGRAALRHTATPAEARVTPRANATSKGVIRPGLGTKPGS